MAEEGAPAAALALDASGGEAAPCAAAADSAEGRPWERAFPPWPARAFGDVAVGRDRATTAVVSGVDPGSTPADFMAHLNSWGLAGTYDFFFLPVDPRTGRPAGYAYINFIDPAFVMVFAWIYRKCHFKDTAGLAELQGLEACRSRWEASLQLGPCASWPVILTGQTPSQWAVDAANLLLAPQARASHFHKTRMCGFFAKGQCRRGAGCSFAHTSSELQPQPSLCKTRLCFAYFAGACQDAACAFAHGSAELRLQPGQQGDDASGRADASRGAGCRAARGAAARSRLRGAPPAPQAAAGSLVVGCVQLVGLAAGGPWLPPLPTAGAGAVGAQAVPFGQASPSEGDSSSTTCEAEGALHRETSEDGSHSDTSASRCQDAVQDQDEPKPFLTPGAASSKWRFGLHSSDLVRVKSTFIDTFSDELPVQGPVRRSQSEGDLGLARGR